MDNKLETDLDYDEMTSQPSKNTSGPDMDDTLENNENQTELPKYRPTDDHNTDKMEPKPDDDQNQTRRSQCRHNTPNYSILAGKPLERKQNKQHHQTHQNGLNAPSTERNSGKQRKKINTWRIRLQKQEPQKETSETNSKNLTGKKQDLKKPQKKDLKTTIENMKAQLEDNKQTIRELSEETETMKTENNELSQEKETLKAEIWSLKQQIEMNEEK